MGVDFRYNPKNAEHNVEIPKEIVDEIEELKQKIISGEIEVASSMGE